MEKRSLLAIGLCLLLWIGYFAIFQPMSVPPPPPEEPAEPAPAAPIEPVVRRPAVTPTPPVEPSPSPSARPSTPVAKEGPWREPDILESPVFRVALTNQGASLNELVLKEFHTAVTRDPTRRRLKLLGEIEEGRRSLVLQVQDLPDGHHAAQARYHLVAITSNHAIYRTVLPQSRLEVEKTFTLNGQSRHIEVTLTFRNQGDRSLSFAYTLGSAAGTYVETEPFEDAEAAVRRRESRYVRAVVGTGPTPDDISVTRYSSSEARKAAAAGEVLEISDQTVQWVGMVNKYFLAILQPRGAGLANKAYIRPIGDFSLTSGISSGLLTLPPGQGLSHQYLFFVGPRRRDVLGRPAYQTFSRLLNPPRFMRSIGRLFEAILVLIHKVTPGGNYGVAIILLTVLVRLALHPLSVKSQTSMQKMQKVAPELKKLKEKFKDDKKRQQQEMMKLYREHGVSPLGGCLPMLLQLPVLIGLFAAFNQAFELRQAGFFFWIQDLAKPDAAFHLGKFRIPIIGSDLVNILPILMVVIMLVQQKLQPKPIDPQQASQQKMMSVIMLVVFGFIFYGFPAGLVLYFFTSTLIGVIEQRMIKRRLALAESQKKTFVIEAPSKPPAGKSRKR